jgi:hypothetical protein
VLLLTPKLTQHTGLSRSERKGQYHKTKMCINALNKRILLPKAVTLIPLIFVPPAV